MIPLFDALAHPTLSGTWLKPNQTSSFDHLTHEMTEHGYSAACAIGMADIGEYRHKAFVEMCRAYPALVPIAGIDASKACHPDELATLKKLGYVGIKIHPRFSKKTRSIQSLQPYFAEAERQDLVVFYCTYMHCDLSVYPQTDPFYELVGLLDKNQSTRVVLVHGGDINIMRYAELVRFNPNLLLDLSLTLMKYRGSSIDADLRFLFQSFDRRIAIGTDYPEYSHEDVRSRFEYFSEGIAEEKQHNIGHRNLTTFLGLS